MIYLILLLSFNSLIHSGTAKVVCGFNGVVIKDEFKYQNYLLEESIFILINKKETRVYPYNNCKLRLIKAASDENKD